MKILEIIPTLGPGGAEALVVDLAINFVRSGSEVRVFLLAGVWGKRGEFLLKRLEDNNVVVFGKEKRKARSIVNFFKLNLCINSWKPDVIHAHLYASQFVFSFVKKFLFYNKFLSVRTLHNTKVIDSKFIFLDKFLCTAFDYTVACSSSVEVAFKEKFQNFNTERLKLIENGCTLASEVTSLEEKAISRKMLGISEGDYIVASVGGFRGSSLCSSPKAQDILLKSFHKAFSNEKDIYLLFAGDGPLLDEAKKYAEKIGISNVIFLGALANPWVLLKSADLFVLPSRNEGLPLALLEAASTGLSIIASNIPEIASLSPSKYWKLFPVGNVEILARTLKEMRLKVMPEDEKKNMVELVHGFYSSEKCSDKYIALFMTNYGT